MNDITRESFSLVVSTNLESIRHRRRKKDYFLSVRGIDLDHWQR